MNVSHYIDLVRYLIGVEADVVVARTQAGARRLRSKMPLP
jgi:hypothetical protein